MFESLDEKFGVGPTILPTKSESEDELPPEVLSDEEVARRALRDMIVKGREGVETALNLAKGSESGKAYEALAQMIKVVSDSSKDLLIIQKIKKDIGKKEAPAGPKTQNNLFVGSTAELMKALRKSSLELLPENEIQPANDN